MNANTVFRWGWRILLVTIVVVSVATVNQPRTGQAGRGPAPQQRTSVSEKRSRADRTELASVESEGATPTDTRLGSSVRSRVAYPPDLPSAFAAAGILDPLCSQAPNCQLPNHAAAHISNRTDVRIADDFRPDANGNISQICWWGIYKRNGDDCYTANVVDTFEVKYCTDAGSLPGTTCTTFKQSDGSLTVSGPTQTADVVFLATAEFAFSATHPNFPVTAGQCYWVEITNDSGSCRWSWETSAEGGDWAMADGNLVDPPDGYGITDMMPRDLAFCANVALSSNAACGPPDNAACSNATQDCCEEGPLDAFGCSDDDCCRRVCACDPFCCDPTAGWDFLCATTGVDGFCGAETVCPSVCSPCGAAESGDCCDANGSASCTDAACCAAVCAVDEFCCDGEWDSFCVDKAEILCPQLCAICGNPASGDCCTATPFVTGCSDRTCCEAVCAEDAFCCSGGWDNNCATIGWTTSRAGALYLCSDLCNTCNLCGDIAGDGISANGLGSNADLADYAAFVDCFDADLRARPECFCSDLNDDQVIDVADHAILIGFLESTSMNLPPNCVTP